MADKKEYQHQIDLVSWAQKNLGMLLVHPSNEGKRSYLSGYILKLMGIRPGFPDLMLFERSVQYPALFIEMKCNREYTKSEMSKESWQRQKWWIDHLNSQGYFATFCFGFMEGAKILTLYRSGNLGRDLIKSPG